MLQTLGLNRNRLLGGLMLAGLAVLVWLSLHLVSTRLYQVDECCNIRGAYLVASNPAGDYAGVDLFQRLLAQLMSNGGRAVDLFVSGRFLMAEVFWLNLILLAAATGEKLLSRRGLFALLGAATITPLWDYGFEIRHDNLLLTGLLVSWCVLKVYPAGLQSYALAGIAAAAMLSLASKAPAYVLPLTLVFLVAPPPQHRSPRWKLALAWLVGAALAASAIHWFEHRTGSPNAQAGGLQSLARMTTTTSTRFAPWETLARLLGQTPLLLALGAAALWQMGATLKHEGRLALRWHGNLPEAGLCLVTLAVLFVNPTPYPYNLVLFAPFLFLLACRYLFVLWDNQKSPVWLPLGLALLIFGHLGPFASATARHLQYPNSRQEGLMRLAEDLTDPTKDPVFDGAGLVPTRPVISEDSFLHGTTIHRFRSQQGPHFRDLLTARPAAVIIPNGRTDWLPPEDHAYIREHYVTVSDDLLVLGKVLPPGGGALEILHPGRYRISTLAGSDLAGSYREAVQGLYLQQEEEGKLAGALDGQSLDSQVVELTAGTHQLRCDPLSQPAVVWVGPRLDRIHRFGAGDHTQVFVNWY
jgi:hypothetical protein